MIRAIIKFKSGAVYTSQPCDDPRTVMVSTEEIYRLRHLEIASIRVHVPFTMENSAEIGQRLISYLLEVRDDIRIGIIMDRTDMEVDIYAEINHPRRSKAT